MNHHELLDRAEIEEVRYRYANALDHQDWDAFLRAFTDDVQTDFSDFGIPPGTVSRYELMQSFKNALSRPGLATQHVFSNPRIHIDGDEATCATSFVGHHFLPGFEGGEEFTLRAEYHDTLARTADGWKIHKTSCKLLFTTGNPNLLTS